MSPAVRTLKRLWWRAQRWDPRRLFLRRHGWVECNRQGLRWRLNVEQYIDQRLYRFGAFEALTTGRVREIVKPGMRVMDVGANFGYFAVHFARLVGPTGHVWAFEPTRCYGERLTGHLLMNGLDGRVTVLPYGLSDRDQELPITIARSSATLHPVLEDVPESVETIRLRRLDDVVHSLQLPGLDLLKIDIDGHEPAMLRGAMETIRCFKPILLIEFSQANLDVAGSDVRELKGLLDSLGYELHCERTMTPYASREAFLRACGNYTGSANVWAFPRTAAVTLGAAA